MIASNKPRQEHNNSTTTQSEKHKGAHECPKRLQFVTLRTQMQTLISMDKVFIEDYLQQWTISELDETNTSIVKKPSKP